MVYRTKEERIVIFKKAVTDAFGKDIYIELLNFFVKFMTERKRARGKSTHSRQIQQKSS